MSDYISRKEALKKIKVLQKEDPRYIGTKVFTEGYFCGLEEAEVLLKQAPAEEVYKLPCKIGDEVFCLRNRNGKRWEIFRGTVTQMYFVEDMRIGIYAKGGSRGEWGKEFFATREEAEAALEEKTLLLKRKKEKNDNV